MLFNIHRHAAFCLICLCLLPALAAQQILRKSEIRNPAFVPERVLLNISSDPAHNQIVTWRTGTFESSAQAQIALATSHPDFENAAATVAATSIALEVTKGKTVGEYAAHFTGLKPDTRYCYRVGDGANWSEWFDFRTAADHLEPFKFIYLGDAQNSIRSLWSRAVRAAYAKAPDARFIAHAGDLVAEGYDDGLWGEWFEAQGFIAASIPSFPVPGNHDLHRGSGIKEVLDTAPIWRAQFSLPHNGPAGIPELDQHSYYVDYEGVRLIAVDVNVYANTDFNPSERQRIATAETAWLEKVLHDNPNRWTIVVQHQPIFAISKERDYEEMRRVLLPLYDKYHVDLVLQGHDHAYARTRPLIDGKPAGPNRRGTIYTISVSGPKMYEATDESLSLMVKEIRNTQMFQVIEVNANQLKYQAFDIEGHLLDDFKLDKPRYTNTLHGTNSPGPIRPTM